MIAQQSDDDAAFVSSQALHQGVQGLHVDVIRRLIQRDDVGLPVSAPHSAPRLDSSRLGDPRAAGHVSLGGDSARSLR